MMHNRASVIDGLFCRQFPTGTTRTFFFCQFDNAESLTARTVIGCLIKQLLKHSNISVSVETKLAELLDEGMPEAEDFLPLLTEVLAMFPLHFVVIDAIDECSKAERELILAMLRSAMDLSRTTVKVFIATRPDLDQQVKHAFNYQHHVSINSSGLQCDIRSYVKDVIAQKIADGQLVVGNPTLITDIQDALIEGAQGMFVIPFLNELDIR